MSRPKGSRMLAKRREVRFSGEVIERTSLLIPSFSSKGFPDIQKIIDTTSEVLDSVVLISAYDVYYKNIHPPFDFASLLFLDSGGYEASKDTDLSELADYQHSPSTWTTQMHEEVIEHWSSLVPTVLISYDNPQDRHSMSAQIERANDLASGRAEFIREILVKPERSTRTLLDMNIVVSY